MVEELFGLLVEGRVGGNAFDGAGIWRAAVNVLGFVREET